MSRFLRKAPARLGLTRAWRAFHRGSVPVLMLHGVLPEEEARPFNSTGKFVNPRELEELLECMSRQFKVMPMDAFIEALGSRARFDNQMLVTFDDGYQNVYDHAFPLLRRMGIPFTVFVATGFTDSTATLWTDKVEFALFSSEKKTLGAGVLPRELSLDGPVKRHAAVTLIKEALKGRTREEADRLVASLFDELGFDPDDAGLKPVRFMSSEEIAEMAAAGVTFGGHSVTHPILSKESAERAGAEVGQCKRTLEEVTRRAVRCFAYPNGRREDFNESTKRQLADAGYSVAFTTIHGLYAPGDDPFEIRRIAVVGGYSCDELMTHASGILKIRDLLGLGGAV